MAGFRSRLLSLATAHSFRAYRASKSVIHSLVLSSTRTPKGRKRLVLFPVPLLSHSPPSRSFSISSERKERRKLLQKDEEILQMQKLMAKLESDFVGKDAETLLRGALLACLLNFLGDGWGLILQHLTALDCW